MLYETYLENMKNLPSEAITIVVMRSAHHILSPSGKLLGEHRKGNMSWEEFEKRYREEMNSETKRFEMIRIKHMAKTFDVYLVCWESEGNCHRHILKKIIEEEI